MAFVFEILNMENMGRDFPGEWLTADLGVHMSDEDKMALRQEYIRKFWKTGREHKQRARNKKVKKSEEMSSTTASPHVFYYGWIVETEKMKVLVIVFVVACVFASVYVFLFVFVLSLSTLFHSGFRTPVNKQAL
jgi:hypothetical protein